MKDKISLTITMGDNICINIYRLKTSVHGSFVLFSICGKFSKNESIVFVFFLSKNTINKANKAAITLEFDNKLLYLLIWLLSVDLALTNLWNS